MHTTYLPSTYPGGYLHETTTAISISISPKGVSDYNRGIPEIVVFVATHTLTLFHSPTFLASPPILQTLRRERGRTSVKLNRPQLDYLGG